VIDGKREKLGNSTFTIEDAQKITYYDHKAAKTKKLTEKDNWVNYTRNMLFARALSNGERWYTPDVFGGTPVYTPDEMGLEEDEDGNIKNITPTDSPVAPKQNIKSLKEAEKEIITTTTEPPYQYQDIPSDTGVTVTITEPTPELKVIPNDPLPYLKEKKPRGRPKAEVKEETPESDDDKGYNPRKEATREPEAEPEQVKEATQEAPGFKGELQLLPSVIKKMEGAESPRMAFEIMNNYAFQGQGHHLKALVKNFCPEFFDRGYSTDQIPETALIDIIKCASGLVMKAVEKTPKCKSKGCKNLMTEPEKELHKGVCWECFAKESVD